MGNQGILRDLALLHQFLHSTRGVGCHARLWAWGQIKDNSIGHTRRLCRYCYNESIKLLHWLYDGIEFMYSRGWRVGCKNNCFSKERAREAMLDTKASYNTTFYNNDDIILSHITVHDLSWSSYLGAFNSSIMFSYMTL